MVGGGVSQPSSLPPPAPALWVSLHSGGRGAGGAHRNSLGSWVTGQEAVGPHLWLCTPKGAPLNHLGMVDMMLRRGAPWVRGLIEPSLQLVPPPHSSPLTPRAAKATRNPGVMIQQVQTCFVPRGSFPACWLPPDAFVHLIFPMLPCLGPFPGSCRP